MYICVYVYPYHSTRCIVIDDIVNSGHTLISAIDALKVKGAKNVYGFVSHARFQEPTLHLLDQCEALDLLVTTDTIPMSNEAK